MISSVPCVGHSCRPCLMDVPVARLRFAAYYGLTFSVRLTLWMFLGYLIEFRFGMLVQYKVLIHISRCFPVTLLNFDNNSCLKFRLYPLIGASILNQCIKLKYFYPDPISTCIKQLTRLSAILVCFIPRWRAYNSGKLQALFFFFMAYRDANFSYNDLEREHPWPYSADTPPPSNTISMLMTRENSFASH